MVSQITGVSNASSTVCSGADQRKKTKLRIIGLYGGNPLVAGEFRLQRASNEENVSIL